MLDCGTGRDDRTGAHEDGHPFIWGGCGDCPTALRASTRVKIVPSPCGEIDVARARLVRRDWRDEERRPEHIFVIDVPHARVAGEVHHEGTHDCAIVEVGHCAEG